MRILLMMALALLAGCAGLVNPPMSRQSGDIDLANSQAAADLAYSRGDLSETAILYRRALTRARAMDDPAAISETAYNIGACEIALGHYDSARPVLQESLDEALRAGDNTADVLLLLAKVAWLRNQPAEALDLCQQVLSSRQSRPTDAHRGQVHLIRGQIAERGGDVTAAEAELAQAKALAGVKPSPGRAAGLENLSGLIEQHRGNNPAAAAAFEREAEDDRNARLFRDMNRALGRAASAWETAGKFQEAGRCYFRAARGALAQGDKTIGQGFLDHAASDSAKAGDKWNIARIDSLRNETQPSQ
jgi:tetratricopeptide (TPR) repeat protein